MHLLLSWLILAFSVWAAAELLPGVKLGGPKDALVVSAVFGILNFCIGYVLFILMGVGTLGLGFLFAFFTRWMVNAVLLKFTAALTPRIQLRSFGWALLCAMFMSALGDVCPVDHPRPGLLPHLKLPVQLGGNGVVQELAIGRGSRQIWMVVAAVVV